MSEDKEIRIKVKGPEDDSEAESEPETAEAGKPESETDGAETDEETAPEEEPSEEDKLRQRVAELEDKLLRTAAEFDNYRKRNARQLDDTVRAAQDRVLLELIEVVDNFERALQHNNEAADLKSLRQGMDLIYNQMQDLLKRHDIKAIDAIGRPFDPNLHEALMQLASEDHEEGTVAVEMARGYKHGDRVLRHTKVGVSSGPSETSKEDAAPDEGA